MKSNFCLLLALSASLVGCATHSASGPFKSDETPGMGIHYYLPLHKLTASVVGTEKTIQTFTDNGGSVSPNRPKTTRKVTASFSPSAYVDRTTSFVLPLERLRTIDNKVTVEQSSNGLLTSISSKTSGKAGELLSSALKFAVNIGTLSSGLPAAGGPGGGGMPTLTKCHEKATPKYRQLEPRSRFIVQHHTVACEIFSELESDHDVRARLKAGLERTQKSIAGPTSASALKKLKTEEAAATGSIEILEKNIAAKAAQLSALIERELTRQKLVNRSTPIEESFEIDLNDLPENPADYLASPGDVTGNPKELFDRVGIALTMKLNGENPQLTDNPFEPQRTGKQLCLLKLDGSNSPKENGSDTCSNHLIFYRRPVDVLVSAYQLKADKQSFKLIRESKQLLVLPQAPLEHLSIPRSAWADGSLSIDFDSNAVPTKVDWDSKATAPAALTAMNNAITSARQEYLDNLKALGEIKAAKEALEPDDIDKNQDLIDELDRLNKELEIKQAQLALQGADASFEANLEESRLQSEQALVAAQLALENSRREQISAEKLADMELQLKLLEKELDILRTTIAITTEQQG